MRFGNRFDTSDLDRWRAAWSAYHAHVETLGLPPDDDLRRYFVAEVFHNSPLHGGVILRGTTLTLRLDNLAARRRLATHAGASAPVIPVARFRTRLRCLGVTACDYRPPTAATSRRPPHYHSAELDRPASPDDGAVSGDGRTPGVTSRHGLRLRLALHIPGDVAHASTAAFGHLDICCAAIEIEDLTDRLAALVDAARLPYACLRSRPPVAGVSGPAATR